ncbi:MAG: MoaD/ThiS family protein [Daejeonella sp.]|uniref:MoaD/ThiS family protein n=1 Tax=Daejeonella sp. JGW-45 TaxID=3034148 RepID=UPI0023EAF1AC|nr:MoaD/ThiS family protein [Daejeonella sp. JGW-45]
MQVKVLIFGQLTDITGLSELLVTDVSTSNELIESLTGKYPELATAKYVVALDKKVISQETQLPDNSTVALLPPFSGG